MEKGFIKRPIKKSKSPLIDEGCIKYLNYRIEQEELSSRIYLAMSMYLDNEGYLGAASLWKKYSQEELVHADWARTYLLSMGVQPDTPALSAPQQSFDGGLPEIIKLSYEHEITVTMQCKDLATDALKKGDHMLYQLALQFLKEQVEESDKTQTWLDKLNSFGDDKIAMRMMDQDMGEVAEG